VNLLFIDESTSARFEDGTKIVALTGILVPAAKYDAVRTRLYESFSPQVDLSGYVREEADGTRYRVAEGWTVRDLPPELHGVKLLPEADDDRKLDACRRVVATIVEFELRVYRVALRLTRSTWNTFDSDAQRYAACWSFLLDHLEPVLREEMIIPVMDSGNRGIEETLPRLVKLRDFVRVVVPGGIERADPTQNLVGEIFFADSKHSMFIQLADIASYLRLQRDAIDAGQPASEFKTSLASIGDELGPATAAEIVRDLMKQGSTWAIAPLQPAERQSGAAGSASQD
jgi:hypothetical protein